LFSQLLLSGHALPVNIRETRQFDRTAALYILVALAGWSTGPNFIRYFTNHMDSWSQNFFRYLTASAFWLPYLLLCARNKRIDRRVWRRALVPAAVNLIMQSLWARSLYYVHPTFMNLLSKSSVLWIAVFSMILFADERRLLRSKRFWSGLVLCAAGLTGVIVFKRGFTTEATVLGIILALSAAMMWGAYTLSAKIAFKDMDSASSFAVNAIYTTIGLGVLAASVGDIGQAAAMTWRLWILMGLAGICPIAIPHVLYYAAMKRIGATIPSMVLLLSVVGVFAISRVCFGESLSPAQLLSGLVLLAGASMAIWSQQHLGPPDRSPRDAGFVPPTSR